MSYLNKNESVRIESDAHSLFLCRVHREFASGQTHNSKEKDVKNQHVYLAK
jgi:hypothetical protein